MIDDISESKVWNKAKKLSNVLVKYLQLPLGDVDYDIICKDILELSEGKMALLTLYEEENNKFKIKGARGGELAYRLLGKYFSVNKRTTITFRDDRKIKFYKIEDVLKDLLDENSIEEIKVEQGIDSCCSIVIYEGKRILGEIIIFMKKNNTLFDTSFLDIYGNYLSSLLIRKNLEKELKEKEERWKFAIENNGDGVWDWDIKTNKVVFSNTWIKMLDYEEEELQKDFQTFIRLIPTEDLQLFYENLQKHFNGEQEVFRTEHKLKCKNGEFKDYLARGKIVGWDANGNPNRMICTHTDITERKKAFEKVAYLCFHDNLTGVYNRAFLEEEMRRLDTKRQLPLTIIMGDVDCLKLVNDAFGHEEGDRLIKGIAKILKKACREEDIIARTGGDEFVIMLPMVTEEIGLRIVEKIKKLCNQDMSLPIQPNISLGVATKTIEEENIFDIYKKAEERMYNNKLIDGKNLKKKIINHLTKTLQEKSQRQEEDYKIIKDLSLKIGKYLELSKEDMEALSTLSSFYDVGLIAVPDKLLSKRALSGIEEEIIKRHCEIGYRISMAIPELVNISEYILCHHEYYNGRGYPQGLKGDDIPLLSRIIFVLETFIKYADKDMALKEIKFFSGSKFDPKVVEALEFAMKSYYYVDI